MNCEYRPIRSITIGSRRRFLSVILRGHERDRQTLWYLKKNRRRRICSSWEDLATGERRKQTESSSEALWDQPAYISLHQPTTTWLISLHQPTTTWFIGKMTPGIFSVQTPTTVTVYNRYVYFLGRSLLTS